MKTLLAAILLLALSCSGQNFYQFNRYDTNLDTTLINGGNLTNLYGTNLVAGTVNSNKLDAATLALLGGGSSGGFNPVVTPTNFISGFVYTNNNSGPIYVSAEVILNIAGATGVALAQVACPSSGVNISHFGQVAAAAGTSYGTLSGFIQPGETYTFTNASTGGGHTISLNPGSGRILSLK